MATIAVAESLPAEADLLPVSLLSQFRRFLWLASGMFSTSSLALAFLDYWIAASSDQATTHFLAAVVAAALFGVATVLKLGPSEA
jgi:hypothetical protein